MACEKIQRPKHQICVGDLDEEITITSRTKSAYNISGIAPDIDSADVYTVWAAHDSYKGSRPFDSSNAQNQNPITDRFIIRYLSDIDVTYVVNKEDVIYQIVDIEHLRKKEFTVIKAFRKGDDTVAINMV